MTRNGQMFFFITFSILCFLPIVSLQAFPAGESAHYELDKSTTRTTSMVRDGSLNLQVENSVKPGNIMDQYLSIFDFELDISMAGRKTGRESILVPDRYFDRDFWENLRRKKTAEMPSFKIRHLGISDTDTIGGEHFSNCDKVLFYDIHVEGESFLMQLWKQIRTSVFPSVKQGEIDDMEFTCFICEGVPALMAAKVDITGSSRGFRFKIGFDLIP